MATKKAVRIDELQAQVRALRGDPEGEAARGLLAKALADPRNALVEAAAQVIGEAELSGFQPALVAAFERLLPDALKSDPMCKGKVAVVNALLALDAPEGTVFLAGVTHRQHQPVYGGSVDTAAELRGLCALGLLRARHPLAAQLVAVLLADVEATARAGAGHALGELDPVAALPLLRYKLALGDPSPEVVGACFRSFLDHAPEPGFEIATTYLSGEDAPAAEAVALALGESRKPHAFELLRDYAATADDSGRNVAFVAMALLRDDTANVHLLEVVATGTQARAEGAVRALAHFRHDPKLRQKVIEAAGRRREAAVRALVEKSFGGE